MNLRKLLGRQYSCIIISIFGLVAVHYLLLINVILWKYPVSLRQVSSDIIGSSWSNQFETFNFVPNQRSIRVKRDLFQVVNSEQTNTTADNDGAPSTDMGAVDFDTSIKDRDTSIKDGTDANNTAPSKDNDNGDTDTSVTNSNNDNSVTTTKDHDDASSDPTLLVLFSSWSHSKEKQDVHQTLLRLWASWSKSLVTPLVLTNDNNVKHNAMSAKWHILPLGEVNEKCRGPPILRGLFTDTIRVFDATFYGFANSDIIFGDGLIRTLRFLRTIYRSSQHPVLIIGRRYNYDFISNHVKLREPREVRTVANDGLLVNQSTDYYFTNAIFPWEKMPKVTIGRLYVARAIVTLAIKHKYDVIDATKTIESVHLTTEDGNQASQSSPGRYCNYFALKESKIRPSYQRFGHCECAKLETAYNKDGEIELRSRDPSDELCGASKK